MLLLALGSVGLGSGLRLGSGPGLHNENSPCVVVAVAARKVGAEGAHLRESLVLLYICIYLFFCFCSCLLVILWFWLVTFNACALSQFWSHLTHIRV